MSMSTQRCGDGKFGFGVAFLFAVGFFVYVSVKHPGPIDRQTGVSKASFTKKQANDRLEDWKRSSPEKIDEGRRVYAANCVYCHSQGPSGKDIVFDRLKSNTLNVSSGPVGLYRVVSNGVRGTSMNRMDYLAPQVRWALVHYLRSEMSQPPESSYEEWKDLEKEGI